MKIVIDIDENVFTRLFDNGMEDYAIVNDDLFKIAKSIRNGTPLPKGHGRLIDADNIIPLALKKKTLVLEDTDLIDIRSRELVIDYLFKDIKDYINNMPTIIESDKENG